MSQRRPMRWFVWLLACSLWWSIAGCQCGSGIIPDGGAPCNGCPRHLCVNGLCQKTQCIPVKKVCDLGSLICSSDGQRMKCVDADSPCVIGRFEPAPCPAGQTCDQGQCVDACQNECTQGETRCDSAQASIQTCIADANGCSVWGQTQPCNPHHRCDQGSCSQCGNRPFICAIGDVRCQGVLLQTCVDSGDPCSSEWQDRECGKRERCDSTQKACVIAYDEADVTAVKKGIQVIGIPGAAGSLTVFGKAAQVVVAGKVDARLYEPVAAITRVEKGRIAALSHDGYLTNEAIHKVADTGPFMRNLIDWLTASQTPKTEAIAVWEGLGIANVLKAAGYDVRTSKDLSVLVNARVVVIWSKHITTPEMRQTLDAFLKRGGGLLIADTAWGWAQLNPGKDLLTDFPGNLFLQQYGIAWTGSVLQPSHADGFDLALPKPPLTALLHVQTSLDLLVKHADAQASPTTLELDEATHIVVQALRHLRDDDGIIWPQFADLVHKHPYIPPTPDKPLASDKALARVLLTYQLLQSWRKSPDRTEADPAADSFPGSVPQGAQRVTVKLDVDTSIPDWHSTGLYAAPGEVITVTIPGQATSGTLALRIGAHTDKIWHKEKWERVPEITRTWSLTQANTKVASAFGGLIYVVVPQGSTLGTISVSIANGVRAPRYVHGATSLTDWRKTIRLYPGPWAELASDKLILTVPSSAIRKLDNPDALMVHWDKVLDACADLATIPHKRARPERVVTDQQISAGYMHAGYPIMTHLDVVQQLSDPTHMTTKGGWGIYHELGHNHQHSDWTFSGTGEVTVNLFTLYIFHTIHKNMQPRTNIYGANRQAMIDKYIKAGANFDTWKADPFLALLMYMQLQEAFGWQPFKQVFAAYRALPAAERPKNDAEKRDQWMVRFANAVGKDLGPFFTAWGIPVSAAAKASISQLSPWMPAGFPPSP